jgi:hypothetical protein
MGRPAHVLLHQPHPGGGFDVEAAAVEADALADDGDARRMRSRWRGWSSERSCLSVSIY